MGIEKYGTRSIVKQGRLYIHIVLLIYLFVSLFSIPLFAQSEIWNPPVFQTINTSKPIKLTVESIPISKQTDVTVLGRELINRIEIQFKNVEPKLIFLSADCNIEESDYTSIIKTVSDRFSHAIVIAVTSSTVFTHKTTEDNLSSVCAFVLGGGNLKFSATVADKTLENFESDDAIADYLSQTLLRTTHDKAVFFFSTFLDEQTNTIIDKFKQKRITNKDSSTIPTGLFVVSGNSKAVYFAGRRTTEAIIAVSISGDITIDIVDSREAELSTLAEKIEILEQSGLGVEGVLASPVRDSDCIKYKTVLQKHVGKLTPVWGISNNDSGQIVLFSTPM